MTNNNTNYVISFNYEGLRETIQKFNDNEFYSSVERIVKKAAIVVAKATIIEEIKLGIYEDSFNNPQSVLENKEMLANDYEAAIQAAYKSLIWLNAKVKLATGTPLMTFYLNNVSNEIKEACYHFMNGITA